MSALVVIICWVLLYRIGSFSLWRIPYNIIPGSDAIRAPSRINLYFGLILVIVVVAGSFHLTKPLSLRMKYAAYALIGVISVEQINTRHFTYSRSFESKLLVQAQPPEFCRSFYLTDSDRSHRDARVVHISANLIGVYHNLRTPMGHSGVFPDEYKWIKNVFDDRFNQGIVTWLESFQLENAEMYPLCQFDLSNRSWRNFASINELEDEILSVPLTQTVIDFSDPNVSDQWLGQGWTRADSWGRWTNGRTADLRLRISDKKRKRRLKFRVGALIRRPHPNLHVRVLVNNRFRVDWHFTYPQGAGPNPDHAVNRFVDLVPNDYKNGRARLRFEIVNPTTPSAINPSSSDLRELGMSVHELIIEER